MKLDEYIFLAKFFEFGTALLAAIIIAWTRHEPPQEAPLIPDWDDDEPTQKIQYIYQLDGGYTAIRERDDTLTREEREIIRGMIGTGNALTYRQAAQAGIKRAAWNRTRAALVTMGLADYGRDGDLIVTSAGMEYFRKR